MAEIKLTQDKVVIVDDEDYTWLSEHKWCYLNTGCAVRAKKGSERDGARPGLILMHREILAYHGVDMQGLEVDHVDHDRLNNRRENLRAATHAQNMRNRKRHTNNTSGLTGVSWNQAAGKWYARISFNDKSKHLGCFEKRKEAAEVYDKAAQKLHGEFATTNFEKEAT